MKCIGNTNIFYGLFKMATYKSYVLVRMKNPKYYSLVNS